MRVVLKVGLVLMMAGLMAALMDIRLVVTMADRSEPYWVGQMAALSVVMMVSSLVGQMVVLKVVDWVETMDAH